MKADTTTIQPSKRLIEDTITELFPFAKQQNRASLAKERQSPSVLWMKNL